MANVLVTVGMGRWPFDRLVAAVDQLCPEHDVFAQIGTATVRPSCPHATFVPYPELLARIAAADVVVTHAGNTVRLVQRVGKVPIAAAREARRGEMGNDHQVAFLEEESASARVVAAWDVAGLGSMVREHAAVEARLIADRSLRPVVDPGRLVATLDAICAELVP
jgi:UDP-N-acetylglucosamine transferase subunit ALG13